MAKGKPHKTKSINVPQETSSITGNQQNVPSDYFKYLLYSVFLFKLVLLMSYLKKLIQKKIIERIPGSKEVHVRNTLKLKTSAEKDD